MAPVQRLERCRTVLETDILPIYEAGIDTNIKTLILYEQILTIVRTRFVLFENTKIIEKT